MFYDGRGGEMGGGCRGGANVQGELPTLFLGRLKSRTSKRLTSTKCT